MVVLAADCPFNIPLALPHAQLKKGDLERLYASSGSHTTACKLRVLFDAIPALTVVDRAGLHAEASTDLTVLQLYITTKSSQ